jgi:hypothetical protein
MVLPFYVPLPPSGNNIWLKEQVIEFSSSTCYFLSFRSKYSPQHTVFGALILSSILKRGDKILHLQKIAGKIIKLKI